MHPGEGSDAEMLDRHALLTDKAVFAHGVHLSDADCSLLAARGNASKPSASKTSSVNPKT